MSDPGRAANPVAGPALLALAACAVALLSGPVAALAYTPLEPILRAAGLTLQHLRPIHETFAFAWVVLGGVAVVYAWLVATGGPLSPAQQFRLTAQNWLWSAAGAGILVTLLAGRFTGREYAGFHPAFAAMILAGWLCFAWNFFGRARLTLRGPAWVLMWAAAIPLFALSQLESQAWLLDAVSGRPLRDLALQWKANGTLIGAANLLAFGALLQISGRLRGDDAAGRSPAAFALFVLATLAAAADFGHHTFHLPQSAWIHRAGFAVSLLEIAVLAGILLEGRVRTPAPDVAVAARFRTSAALWTLFMLGLAVALTIPPLNAMLHGTHVVVAHAMGSLIGIDSMILWMAFAWLLREHAGPAHPTVRCPGIRAAVTFLDASLALFLAALLARGLAAASARALGTAAPDLSPVVAAFPWAMAVFGSAFASVAGWILVRWAVVFARSGKPEDRSHKP
ncbi:MAG: hypothetical protein HYY18_14980 [Planctomycetes bacterium]|nr:hypothetical protein [Planctomycetota bacterium]